MFSLLIGHMIKRAADNGLDYVAYAPLDNEPKDEYIKYLQSIPGLMVIEDVTYTGRFTLRISW